MTRLPCCPSSLLATAIGLCLATASASAQQTPATPPSGSQDEVAQLDTVVVTSSYQQSLATALDNKRDDVRMTDGISSEDIGKFPAENIAEAIQRIPGVQISSINGRGSTISIRGLGPQYANTTINGQTFKSADFTDGFRYDIIQPELAAGIQVIKSPTADMDAGGLSGTVNIDTVKPLDYKERKLIFSAKAQQAEFADGSATPKGVISYIDQFADGTVGLFLNAGYQKLEDRADYFWLDRWFTTQTEDGTVYTPRRPRYRRIDRETERKMFNGALQWKPNDRLEMGLTAIYSQDQTDNDINQQVFLFNQRSLTVLEQQGLTSTRVLAEDYTLENNRQIEHHDLTSQMLTYDFKWKGDTWTFSGAANHTVGKTDESEAAAILGVTVASSILDISNPSNIIFEVSDDLTDAGWYDPLTMTRNEYPNGAIRKLENKEDSLQLDAERWIDKGFISSVRFGAKYRRETFDRNVWRRDRYIIGDADPADLPTMAEYGRLTTGFLDGDMSVQHAWIVPDIAAYEAALAAEGITIPTVFAPQGSYSIENDIYAGYALAKIDTEIGSMPLRGNVGVRYEKTQRRTDTYVTTPSETNEEAHDIIGTASSRYNYDNWLPSANFVLELHPNLLLRLSAAKVLVRPILDSNTAIATTVQSAANSQDSLTYTIDLGQPDLKPLTADQADLSLEWYYGGGSGVSVAGFIKKVKNGTYAQIVCPGSFGGTSLAVDADGDCVDSAGNIYDITETLNDSNKVTIKGYELAWTQSFDAWLPISGFGLTANYTRVIPEQSEGYRIRNLSEKTWNVTGFWENERFSARVSLNHRSEYEQDSSDSFFAREGHTVEARNQIDAVLGWRLNDKLSFSLGALNLNDNKEEAYKDIASRWQMTSVTGRSYYLSMQWDLL